MVEILIRKKMRKKPKNIEHQAKDTLCQDLEQNIDRIKQIFEYPTNEDFYIREIFIGSLNLRAFLMFYIGAVDINKVEDHILKPLTGNFHVQGSHCLMDQLTKQFIQTVEIKRTNNFTELTKELVDGYAVLIFDGYNEALSIRVTKFEGRSVPATKIENVIKGPKEAFVESRDVNRSLIRKHVRTEKLVSESIKVGDKSVYSLSMMYIKNIADPKLVNEVRDRIKKIRTEGIFTISTLEQHIEERPYSLVPTVLYTERPDRASAFLSEGFIILVDSSPGCLIVPVTLWSFFHSPEDQYQRWAYGNFMRLIRFLSFIIALFTPALYIGLSVYHVEMIPTDLLLSIASMRELVPFPVFIEVLMMEVSFELIREAGTRVPTPLGPTISIVGALILGQAAVQAGIVSPILVIVVAITGLASYAIPEISSNYMIRIGRFFYLGIASLIGFYGIALFFTASIAYMASIKSFGVPFLSPKAPHYPSSKDLWLRPPVWKQWLRPTFVKPQEEMRANMPKKGDKDD